MRGRRPKDDPRLMFYDSGRRAKHDADGRGSFVAVERSRSDSLLKGCGGCSKRPASAWSVWLI
jgi:hypothetical protein